MEIYLVGGAVRDAMMGVPVHDRDYVVFGADEEAFLARFPRARRVGRRQPVYIVTGDEYTLAESVRIEDDLARRDLTINAMARDAAGRLTAWPGALDDLRRRRLRPVARENFFRDPLRAVRAARFSARYPDFHVTDELRALMQEVGRRGLLAEVAAERVGAEVRRGCGTPRPDRFVDRMAAGNLLVPWLAELQAASRIPAGPPPHHEGTLLAHTAAVAGKLQAAGPLAVWMGLCHDLGKTATDPEHWPRHHRHEHLGEGLATRLGRRLRMPGRWVAAGAVAARWHMTAGRYDELRPATRVRLLTTLERAGLLGEMFALVAADKGRDFGPAARRDAGRMRAVRLPERHRSRGAESGRILHELRCRALRAAGRDGEDRPDIAHGGPQEIDPGAV